MTLLDGAEALLLLSGNDFLEEAPTSGVAFDQGQTIRSECLRALFKFEKLSVENTNTTIYNVYHHGNR